MSCGQEEQTVCAINAHAAPHEDLQRGTRALGGRGEPFDRSVFSATSAASQLSNDYLPMKNSLLVVDGIADLPEVNS